MATPRFSNPAVDQFFRSRASRRPRRCATWPWALALLAGINCAVAPCAAANCKPTAQIGPFAARLDRAPVVFAGTVVAVDRQQVSFDVLHVLTGAANQRFTAERLAVSPCGVTFNAGQIWLFAGTDKDDPSVMLGAAADVALTKDAIGRLRRVDDAGLKLPRAWQACTTNAQCTIIPFGCQRTAATSEHAVPARQASVRIAGDPRTLNCQHVHGIELLPHAMCWADRCGQWAVDLRGSP